MLGNYPARHTQAPHPLLAQAQPPSARLENYRSRHTQTQYPLLAQSMSPTPPSAASATFLMRATRQDADPAVWVVTGTPDLTGDRYPDGGAAALVVATIITSPLSS